MLYTPGITVGHGKRSSQEDMRAFFQGKLTAVSGAEGNARVNEVEPRYSCKANSCAVPENMLFLSRFLASVFDLCIYSFPFSFYLSSFVYLAREKSIHSPFSPSFSLHYCL